MAWIELVAQRNQRSRTYGSGAAQRCWEGVQAPLHYEGEIDSEVYDTEVDFAPIRVDNPQFDGWRVTQADWHYALGKDLASYGDQDGWVGFGGRQGAHWFKFRLLRIGYLHWPTRVWDDIGGSPEYDRANLQQRTGTLTIGPNNDEVNISTVAEWSDIWNTPGGGEVSVRWVAGGDRLKEHIVVNEAARGWIHDNAPPGTPLNETYFGFVLRLDWSDIPKVVRDGVLQDVDGDFADDGESIEMRDALDRLLGFMLVSDVRVPGTAREPLRKRFYKDGDDHYLLVGVRCDVLNGMAAGDLVFDPTVDKQVAAGSDDGRTRTGDTSFSNSDTAPYAGYVNLSDYEDCEIFARWTGVTIEGTIDVSHIELYQYEATGGTPELKVYGIDEDNPAAPTTYAEFYADALTAAAVDWDGVFAVGWDQSPSLNTIFQELVDTYTISNDAVMVQVRNDQTDTSTHHAIHVYNYEYDDNTWSPKLHIEYTVGILGERGTLRGLMRGAYRGI